MKRHLQFSLLVLPLFMASCSTLPDSSRVALSAIEQKYFEAQARRIVKDTNPYDRFLQFGEEDEQVVRLRNQYTKSMDDLIDSCSDPSVSLVRNPHGRDLVRVEFPLFRDYVVRVIFDRQTRDYISQEDYQYYRDYTMSIH